MTKNIPAYSSKECYMRHIARANNIIFKEVLNNLNNPNNNEQQ